MVAPPPPIRTVLPRAPRGRPQPDGVARLPFREDMVGGPRVSANGDESIRYRHYLGAMEYPCIYCGAMLFRDEVKANNHVTCGQCCNSGKVLYFNFIIII